MGGNGFGLTILIWWYMHHHIPLFRPMFRDVYNLIEAGLSKNEILSQDLSGEDGIQIKSKV